ncbi:MAG: PfkB family carbohydrate kinase [Endomicrobia bacterium]|nr:PfkB family carbohydrate kinase [Endomicrobiia bacterium]MCL2507196.1 PfkB family carbohydrate kinase [Endomicrobiia bacterium]
MKILALACFCVDVFPESGKILPGGNALNLAVNCKENGADVFVMGNIGKDNYGEILKQSIDKYKINRERIYETNGQTANHIINIDEHGDRYFGPNAWTSGVWGKFKISENDKEFIKTFDAIATTLYEPDFKNIIEASKDACLAVDFHDNKIKPEYEQYFKHIDLFFVSGKQQDSPEFRKTLKAWSEQYKTIFTATLGEYGSISYKDGKKFVCPAVKVEKVIDTTGCGDSYQAGFIMQYLKNKNIEQAMQAGSEFASKTLSYIGGFKI